MNINFNELFEIVDHGYQMIIKKCVKIDGMLHAPIKILGTKLGGIDWKPFENRDIWVLVDNDPMCIHPVYIILGVN